MLAGVAHSQEMSGTWEKTILCKPCPPPAGIAFDESIGVIVLKSQRLGGFPPPHRTTVYATLNGGITWDAKIDTIYHSLVPGGVAAVLHNGLLVMNSFGGATTVSTDLGDSIEVINREPELEYDFHSPSAETLFRLKGPVQNERRLEFAVSRDTGRSYTAVSVLQLPEDDLILSARFRDSNEIWVSVVNSPPSPSLRKLRRLLYSLDQGANWNEVFPFGSLDTAGVNANNSFFGNGGSSVYEGIQPGAEPGTLYLLSNSWKSNTPERKLMDLLLTTDYGKTWTGDSSHVIPDHPYIDVEFIRNPVGSKLWLLLSNKQTLAYSSDNSKTWVHDSVTFRGNPITHMLWKDSLTGYVLTYSADSVLAFWKYIPGRWSVQHLDDPPKPYFKLQSTVLTIGALRAMATRPLAGQFAVYDILGRMVWSADVTAARSESIELDVPSLAGNYFLVYIQGFQRQSVRYVHE